MIARLAVLFGVPRLMPAAPGRCEITACTVEQRTTEIGVRMAFLADRRQVIRMGDARSMSGSRHRLCRENFRQPAAQEN